MAKIFGLDLIVDNLGACLYGQKNFRDRVHADLDGGGDP